MKYIATRPRAERLGAHGLFGDEDGVNLDKTLADLERYTGNVWTHIISLKREDAARLGYDNAEAWRNLLRTHRNEIASAMNIPANDFRWYAAFHDEGDHPHCHMTTWLVKPGQAYLNRDGIRQIKSELTNDIFRMEMLHLYEQKSASRDELVWESRKVIRELTWEMRHSLCAHPEAEQLMQKLSEQLNSVNGKKSYGYLPKQLKKLVDEIVDQMEQLPVVKECYEKWLELQWQVDTYYKDKPKEHPPLSKQKEFRQIKNAVIREAERIHLGEVTFEDRSISREDEPDEEYGADYDYWYLRDVIRDEDRPLSERDEAVVGMTKLAEAGDPYAQCLMGKLWRDGPLLIPDRVNARHWFGEAAKQDHVAAQYALGKLLLSDDAEVRDPKQGSEWLVKAADNGSQYAAYRLGKEYLKGKAVERDAGQAVKYFTQAAEAGNQFAQYMLGKLYLAGEDVPQDREQARYWFTLSADQGNSYAQFFLDRWEQMRPPSVMLSVSRLLYHVGRIFMDNAPPPSATRMQTDKKLRQKIRQKKIAMGHKPDDHEEQIYIGPTMSM